MLEWDMLELAMLIFALAASWCLFKLASSFDQKSWVGASDEPSPELQIMWVSKTGGVYHFEHCGHIGENTDRYQCCKHCSKTRMMTR